MMFVMFCHERLWKQIYYKRNQKYLTITTDKRVNDVFISSRDESRKLRLCSVLVTPYPLVLFDCCLSILVVWHGSAVMLSLYLTHSWLQMFSLVADNPANTKHFYDIFTRLDVGPALYTCYTNVLCLRIIQYVYAKCALYIFDYWVANFVTDLEWFVSVNFFKRILLH